MRTKFITLQLVILFLSVGVLIAQQNTELKEKIKNIKGEVNSITISTTEGNVTFEGKDARKLFKKLKSKSLHKKLMLISDDGNDGKKVNINVEDENGEKKVTVKTIENGKEKVKVYEGEEAEKYLEENENIHHFNVDVDDTDKNSFLIYTDDDLENIDKEIDVKIIDGSKKITVITKINGDEDIEVYEGEEAEKFLKEMAENEGSVKMFKKMKGNKKIKKILIKRIEDDK